MVQTKHITGHLMRLGVFVRDFGGSLEEDNISDDDLTYALTMVRLKPQGFSVGMRDGGVRFRVYVLCGFGGAVWRRTTSVTMTSPTPPHLPHLTMVGLT
jgi:hypothetical protein